MIHEGHKKNHYIAVIFRWFQMIHYMSCYPIYCGRRDLFDIYIWIYEISPSILELERKTLFSGFVLNKSFQTMNEWPWLFQSLESCGAFVSFTLDQKRTHGTVGQMADRYTLFGNQGPKSIQMIWGTFYSAERKTVGCLTIYLFVCHLYRSLAFDVAEYC